MADEALSDHIEFLLQRYFVADSTRAIWRAAIHRFASEREAAALERAAMECLQAKPSWNRNDLAERIRALIHKEPANG